MKFSRLLAVVSLVCFGASEFQPRLVISKDEAGTLSWTSDAGAHSFKVKVSWAW
jgi:hypothetical protein